MLSVESLDAIRIELSCDRVLLRGVKLELGACPIELIVVLRLVVGRARAIAERIHATAIVITDVVFSISVFATPVVRVRSALINASVSGHLLCSSVTLKEIHLRAVSASHCLSITVLGSSLSTTLVFGHSNEVHSSIEAAAHSRQLHVKRELLVFQLEHTVLVHAVLLDQIHSRATNPLSILQGQRVT